MIRNCCFFTSNPSGRLHSFTPFAPFPQTAGRKSLIEDFLPHAANTSSQTAGRKSQTEGSASHVEDFVPHVANTNSQDAGRKSQTEGSASHVKVFEDK
jgi:hypothetical protein